MQHCNRQALRDLQRYRPRNDCLRRAVFGACCYIAYNNERRVRREEAMREEREAQVPVGSTAAVFAGLGLWLRSPVAAAVSLHDGGP